MLEKLLCSILAATQLAISSAFLPSEKAEVPEPPSYIIHAAGNYSGLNSTNSLEALKNAYEKGNRYIELDFNFTSDFKPVCIHDWNHLVYSGYDGTKPTEEEFMLNNIYGIFTPMNLEIVADFMIEHQDLYIITDVKDLNVFFSDYIRDHYPELMNRFVIQVYHESEYEYVSKMGFENIIFSLYKLDWESKTDTASLVEFAKNNKLFGYTFPASLCDMEGYVSSLLDADVPLFIHTVNDKKEQQKYFEMGISGIYTDNVTHN